MKFVATAEHTQGRSISHSCTRGAFDDPSEWWEMAIEAETEDEARDKAVKAFEARVQDWGTCHCRRKLAPGGREWWESVSVSVVQD